MGCDSVSLITVYEYFEGLFSFHLQVQNKCGDGVINLNGHTAITVVTQIGGRECRGNPIIASSRCEQTIWEQQRSNCIFTPTIFALKKEAEYSFESLVYTQSALWMLHCPVEQYRYTPLYAFMVSYWTKCTFTFTTARFLQATVLYSAPPLLLFLSSHPGVLPKYLQSLRYVVCAVAPLGVLDTERFLKRAPPNTEILQGSMGPLLW